MTNFFQILWRPRPATLLTKNKINDIKKNLQKYSAIFSKQDEAKDTTSKLSLSLHFFTVYL